MDRPEPYPAELRHMLLERMDFECAFQSLEEYTTHYYSDALRGYLCRLLYDLPEAWRYLRRAEERYEEAGVPGPEDEQYLFNLRLFRTGTAILSEADGSGATAQTDAEMVRFSGLEKPVSREHDRTRATQISYYNLIRGNFELALETFDVLIDREGGRFQDRQVGLYCGAAAAAHGLGRTELAEKHYESAALGVSMLETPFRVATYASRLHVLAALWGNEDEAVRWLQRIESLDCPPRARRYFLRCAEVFVTASRAAKGVFMP